MKHSQTTIDSSLLPSLKLFRNISPESIETYLERSVVRELKEGEILVSPTKKNTDLFSLLSGRLQIHLGSITKDPHVNLEPGECVGEMSIIEQREPSAYVIASENSRVLGIDQDTLWAMVNASHTIARNLLYILSGRLRQGNAIVADSIEKQHRYEQEAKIDALTGLHNRRWMDEMFDREIKRCTMDEGEVCMAMLDVDHFKKFNDRYGHLVGDHILSTISGTLRHSLRPNDMIVRYGGDEFVILLPQTKMPAALMIAERLKRGIAELSFGETEAEILPGTTISIGVAQMQDSDTLDKLLFKADTALYYAKNSGRNRISTQVEPVLA